tara:strand:- start:136 stop:339 length:204 start_codon:yes stop_codon:yes gene_type:complete
MAKIQLNGVEYKFREKTKLKDILKKFKIEEKKVAIEINGSIIHSHQVKKYEIKNNDKIEIVHFIGGG